MERIDSRKNKKARKKGEEKAFVRDHSSYTLFVASVEIKKRILSQHTNYIK